MNQRILPANLKIFWEGEEHAGFTCYDLITQHGHTVGFPVDVWKGALKFRPHTMRGEGWSVDVWDCRVDLWPRNWQDACEKTLRAFVEGGGEVAWIGLGEIFVEPPDLFAPAHMSGGVLVAISRSAGSFVVRRDEGFESLTDQEMLRLRDSLPLRLRQ